MILKGRTRADGGKLADYLLSSKNEQVRVLDISGTVIDDRSPAGLKAALQDMDELGKMTRAKSSLFHLAINPNDNDRMTPDGWKAAVEKAEKALGLEGQPRVIVSHIYEGKEHLHVAWSRVDVEQRKCIEMSFSKLKLCQAAREIEIEQGLQQTPARARGAHRLKQHIKDIQQQQDERSKTPRQQLNEAVKNAWEQSANGQEFKKAIEDAGYSLAMGHRYISVMNAELENYPVQRCVDGLKVKDVRLKLDDLEGLPTVDEVRARAKAQTEETKETTKTERADDTKKPLDKYQEPTRRHADNWTEVQHERGFRPANDDQRGDFVQMPWETDQEAADRAARAVADEKQRRDAGAKTAEDARENSGLVKADWETADDFAARVLRAASDPNPQEAEQQHKAEMHYRPKGRTLGR